MASFGDYNRVNTNVTAMDAQLSLNKINRDLGESRLRLSTGYKINNAEDDAAGFAIATKLKSRVAGLEQALQNVGDAKSILGIVEGAYGSIMDNLIEMKSLATQGANETLGSDERGYIETQISALAVDINDIAKSTTYNNVALLDGAANNAGTNTFTFQVGEGTGDTKDVGLQAVNTSTLIKGSAGAADADLAGDGFLSISAASADRGTLTFAANADDGTMRAFLTDIDTAIGNLNSLSNGIGISQRSLSNIEVNLTEALTANNAAKSRIMDTDFAKEQSNSIRLQILQQTATAALSQANMGPQAVLGFLG